MCRSAASRNLSRDSHPQRAAASSQVHLTPSDKVVCSPDRAGARLKKTGRFSLSLGSSSPAQGRPGTSEVTVIEAGQVLPTGRAGPRVSSHPHGDSHGAIFMPILQKGRGSQTQVKNP